MLFGSIRQKKPRKSLLSNEMKLDKNSLNSWSANVEAIWTNALLAGLCHEDLWVEDFYLRGEA